MIKQVFPIVILLVALAGAFTASGGAGSVTVPRGAAESYAKHCASCHGRDGRAKTTKGKRTHSRNLADPEWQNRVSDERIFNSIMNGKGKMPDYSKKLSEQEIDALVIYVRSLGRL
ncbi:MAG TPA: cytochrome c [Pyrinomonadaceae bacterium]